MLKIPLRVQAVAFIVCLFSGLSGSLYFQLNGPILSNFRRLELEALARNVGRIEQAVFSQSSALQQKCSEWAHWDEMYDYVVSRDTKFENSNLVPESFQVSDLSHIIFLDLNGKVLQGHKLTSSGDGIQSVTKEEKSFFNGLSRYLTPGSPSASISGIVRLGADIFLISAASITDSAIEAPPRGTLLFSRRLGEQFQTLIAETTKLDLQFDFQQVSLPEEAVNCQSDWPSTVSVTAKFCEAPNSLIAYGILSDLSGNPVLPFSVKTGRAIYHQGEEIRDYVVGGVITAAVIGALATILFFQFIVLNPLSIMGRQAAHVGENVRENLTLRLNETVAPELKTLAYQINQMLEQLGQSFAAVESARNTAQSANAAKSTFLAKVSHELRTPIHGILGMHRMAMKQEKSRAVRELIGVADDCARGLLGTINEILDFSKAESGNLTVEQIPVAVRDVVRSALQIVSGRLDNKPKLSLVCDLDPEVPVQITGDPTRLQQVLVNLVGNAVKFTEEGTVTLRVTFQSKTGTDGTLAFYVIDTGIGIPSHKLADIFEPFKQADDTVTRKYQGTGLGLSIVKQFCDVIGGQVKVESVEGRGSTFSVFIPTKGVAPRHTQLLDRSALWPVPLLIGRDSPAIDILRHNFKTLGVTSTWVSPSELRTGVDITEKMRAHNLLIAFDDALQNSEVYKELVRQAKQGDIPGERCAIAVLSPSSVEVREQLYDAGLKTILTSPVICDDIVDSFYGEYKASTNGDEVEAEPLSFDRKLRVLVADDSETNRIILQDMLTSAGHEVVCVDDGREVVRLLSAIAKAEVGATPFDVVLSDIQMPHLDGWSAAKAVREVERESGKDVHTPIIAATAHPIEHRDQRLKEAGIDGLVSKPIEPKELAAELQRILGREERPNVVRPRVTETSIVQFEVELDSIVRALMAPSGEHRDATGSGNSHEREYLNIPSLYKRLGRSLPRTLLVLRVSAQSIEERIEKLNEALAHAQSDEIRRSAHALKGLLLEVGAERTAQLAQAVDDVTKRDPVPPKDMIRALSQASLDVAHSLGALTERLEEYRQSPGAASQRRPGNAEQLHP